MAARLGHVLYVIGSILTSLSLLGTTIFLIYGIYLQFFTNWAMPDFEGWVVYIVGFTVLYLLCLVPSGIGYALCYILGGFLPDQKNDLR